MYIRSYLVFAVLYSLPALAQQSLAGSTKQTAKQTAAATKAVALTVDSVLSMVDAGISDDVIIARLRKEDKPFDLSPDDIIRLKKAKVSDAVLKVMLDPQAEIKPAAPPPSSPRAIQSAQPITLPVPVIPSVATASRSGATPAPGATAEGDPNDPLVPHDSGIYLYTKDREGKPQMIVLERASYQGAKTGGFLASSLTYGIKKVKTKAEIPGPRANVRVSETSPVFYFYFDDKQAGLGKTYFGVGNLSNPNQFALLKLDVNKSNRETMVGQFSMLGSSSGSDAKSMVPFKSEPIRTGLYKVTIEALMPGEYCFLAGGNATTVTPYGAYGAGAAGGVDIFDFGMSPE